MSNIAKWRQIPESEFRKMVAESLSYRELAKKAGYAQDSGSATRALKDAVRELNIDTSHFLGKGINKGKFTGFEEASPRKRGSKMALPLIQMRGHKCENCGCSKWCDELIPLQVHHIDGDRSNNSLENLKLLCPNCHALTENYCRKDLKRETIDEARFVNALQNASSIHRALKDLGINPTGGNYERARRLIEKQDIKHLQK